MRDGHGGGQWAGQDLDIHRMDEGKFAFLFMKSNWPKRIEVKRLFGWEERQDAGMEGDLVGRWGNAWSCIQTQLPDDQDCGRRGCRIVGCTFLP